MVGYGVVLVGCVKVKGEGKGILVDLFFDCVRVMGCVYFEGVVVCLEVDRVGNVGVFLFKDLLRLLVMCVVNDWRLRLKGCIIFVDLGLVMLNLVLVYFF